MGEWFEPIRSAAEAAWAQVPTLASFAAWLVRVSTEEWTRLGLAAVIFVAIGVGLGRRRARRAMAGPQAEAAAEAKAPATPAERQEVVFKKIEHDLKERGLPPAEIAERIREFPGKFRELRDAVGSFDVGESKLKALLDDARKIMDEGELRRAVNMLFYVGRNSSEMARDEKAAAEKHLAAASGTWALAGDLEMAQAEYASAGEFYRQSLASLPDGADGVRAKLLEKRGFAAYRGHDFATAVEAFQKSVEIVERTLGKDHADLAAALNNLGLAQTASGGLDQAEPIYRRALAIDEKAWGPNHPGVAADLNNLALLYKKQGKLDAAEAALKRSVGIKEKVFEAHHPVLVSGLKSYAALLHEMKRDDEARAIEARIPKPPAAAPAGA